MFWTRSETISALALLVSALGFGLSIFSLWRTFVAEKPIAWIELTATGPDRWIAKIKLRNRSSIDLRPYSVSVPINTLPISKKQDFLLGEYKEGAVHQGERALKLSFSSSQHEPVRPGQVGTFPVLLFRGQLSSASAVTMQFCVQSMDANPRFETLTMKSPLPSNGLRIELS